ncbi:C40 family peptidase [Terrabacter sp. NPDC000476]|uniref:C40 family peptidase n=1 Tax=Terrabacter sp. NPDC000476 TaxID=3154258 RepID=UPI003318122E
MSTPVAVIATHRVRVPVTTVWTSPTSPRPVDAPAVAEQPDAVAWLAALDAHDAKDPRGRDDESGDGRLGLHGRVETQLVAGEPVVVTETDATGAWSHVVAPWQASPKDARGYPGWVPTAHLTPVEHVEGDEGDEGSGGAVVTDPAPADTTTDEADDSGVHPAVAEARRHIGLPYLWSGLTPLGFDCSGLVLHAWRRLGIVVARDAYAQAEVAEPVALDAVEPGDLYFFARPGRRIHHVGIVVRPGRMVHASETGGVLVEEDLPDERVATLVAAGRLPMP